PNPKSEHYLARLEWTKTVEFQAGQMLEGSTASPAGDGSVQSKLPGPAEALYEVSMIRAGDYGFRVKLCGGSALLRVADRTYELYQPGADPRWLDLARVRLSAGSTRLSLILPEGSRAEAIGITPPCILPIEPAGGWQPLEPLRFEEMAVTIAKALELEQNLPATGDPIEVRGEEFVRTFSISMEGAEPGPKEPFWLSTGNDIVTASARFEVPEDGIYSIEARYLSGTPVRWNMDSCLRVITCPVVPAQAGRRRSLALALDAGEHEIEVTLGPGSKLDRIQVQRRDGSTDAYIGVVEAEGFKMGGAGDDVQRRDALAAARRLRDRFVKFEAFRCEDGLVAMEAKATASAIQALGSPGGGFGNAPAASAGATQIGFSEPVFPPVSGDEPEVASPVMPGTASRPPDF
ncbi:MAG TPA: hypothetical protein VJ921_05010, partial [Vicinamibacteria bacterium]|nr:hypothetical protein [Vicinamibacteria bacterium]